MAIVRPAFSRAQTDRYINTWYRMAEEGIVDQVKSATPMSAIYNEMGSFKYKDGGHTITGSIKVAKSTASTISRGSTLPQSSKQYKAVIEDNWKYIAEGVTQNFFDKVENSGPDKIYDQMEEDFAYALESMTNKLEASFFKGFDASAGMGDEPNSLNTLIPTWSEMNTAHSLHNHQRATRSDYAANSVGVRVPANTGDNHYWGPLYKEFTAQPEINLESDMNSMVTSLFKQQSKPNLILTGMDTFQTYQEIVKNEVVTQVSSSQQGKILVDLGYEVLFFRGIPIIYVEDEYTTSSATGDGILRASGDVTDMLFVNLDYVDFWINSNADFVADDDFKRGPNELDAVMHIVFGYQLMSTRQNVHGRLTGEAIA